MRGIVWVLPVVLSDLSRRGHESIARGGELARKTRPNDALLVGDCNRSGGLQASFIMDIGAIITPFGMPASPIRRGLRSASPYEWCLQVADIVGDYVCRFYSQLLRR